MPPDTQFALGEERYLFPSLLRVSYGTGTQLSPPRFRFRSSSSPPAGYPSRLDPERGSPFLINVRSPAISEHRYREEGTDPILCRAFPPGIPISLKPVSQNRKNGSIFRASNIDRETQAPLQKERPPVTREPLIFPSASRFYSSIGITHLPDPRWTLSRVSFISLMSSASPEGLNPRLRSFRNAGWSPDTISSIRKTSSTS